MMALTEGIWVFCGEKSQFPSGVFNDLSLAQAWIASNSLSGTLTQYPVNEGVYDWAIRNEYFRPSSPQQLAPAFIGRFSSAALEHHHYQDGHRVDS